MEGTGAAGSANGGKPAAQPQQVQAGNTQPWISAFAEAALPEAERIGMRLTANTNIADLA